MKDRKSFYPQITQIAQITNQNSECSALSAPLREQFFDHEYTFLLQDV